MLIVPYCVSLFTRLGINPTNQNEYHSSLVRNCNLFDKRLIPTLIKSLDEQYEPNENVRWQVADILGESKSTDALSALTTALETDSDESVRRVAAEAIEKIKAAQGEG